MFLINLNTEIIACILSFRKSRHKPNVENTTKYGFSPDLGKKWRRSEHAHASYPGVVPGVRFSKDPGGAGRPSHNALRMNYSINGQLSRDPLVDSGVHGVKSTVF